MCRIQRAYGRTVFVGHVRQIQCQVRGHLERRRQRPRLLLRFARNSIRSLVGPSLSSQLMARLQDNTHRIPRKPSQYLVAAVEILSSGIRPYVVQRASDDYEDPNAQTRRVGSKVQVPSA